MEFVDLVLEFRYKVLEVRKYIEFYFVYSLLGSYAGFVTIEYSILCSTILGQSSLNPYSYAFGSLVHYIASM